jgi:hypothetical protein
VSAHPLSLLASCTSRRWGSLKANALGTIARAGSQIEFKGPQAPLTQYPGSGSYGRFTLGEEPWSPKGSFDIFPGMHAGDSYGATHQQTRSVTASVITSFGMRPTGADAPQDKTPNPAAIHRADHTGAVHNGAFHKRESEFGAAILRLQLRNPGNARHCNHRRFRLISTRRP